ncbi:MAG: protein kinase [Syntrophales bacterium]|jgi:serine/threonine protein kinase
MTGVQDLQEDIVNEFIEKCISMDDSNVLKEYCDKYPSLEKVFEQKYNLVKLLNDNFDVENLVGKKIGDYVIYEEIGRGGMGIVYLAWQVSLERFAALKVLPFGLSFDPGLLTRFQREAKIIARFAHPNIVPIYSYGEEKGTYYIAMAFVPGLSLNKIIAGLKKIPPAQVNTERVRDIIQTHEDFIRLKSDSTGDGSQDSITTKRDPSFWNMPYHRFVFSMFAEILDAIIYAHKNNIFHGDIKPSNIMLTAEGIPVLVDFGLARDIKALVTTQSSDFLGTIAYSAPEQIQSNRIDHYTDVWSLGVTLYELLSLKHPFYMESLSKSISNIIHEDPPLIRSQNKSFPKDADAVVMKCLEKTPEKRYANAELLKRDMINFLDSKPISAKPVGVVGKSLKWIKRNLVISILILGLLFAGALSSFLYLRNTVENLINEGSVFYDHGNYIESQKKYEQALRYVNMFPYSEQRQKNVLSKLGDVSLAKGNYEEARKYYERILEIDHSYTSALSGLGQVHLETGHYEDAIRYYNQAIPLSPMDRDARYELGLAYEYAKRYEEAIKSLQAALRIAPKDEGVLKEIKSVLNELRIPDSQKRKCLEARGFYKREIESILK